jgi:hypothetical protein
MNILAWYDTYVIQGLEPIPLKPQTKEPLEKRWQRGWDEDHVRHVFSKMPHCNMGLRLGDVMDVEGDTPAANKRLMRLTKNCPHPMYTSFKSVHHLFLSPDPDLTIVKWEGIEFRGRVHQSALPPSRHKGGPRYTWHPESRFPIPKMPASILDLLKIARNQDSPKPGSKKIYCSLCREKCVRNYKRIDLEIKAFKCFGEKWECQKCRKRDVRALCREIRKKGL